MQMNDLAKFFDDEVRRNVVRDVLKNNVIDNYSYSTNYSIYDNDRKLILETNKASCYAQLPMYAYKERDRVRYIRTLHIPVEISEKEGIRWIEICKEAGAIGDTLQYAEEIFHQGLFIDLMNPYWSVDRLYITLCNYRFIREAVTMVRNIIALVDYAKIPFWHAFTFSHGHSYNGILHSWLGWGAGPYTTNGCSIEKNNLWFSRWLRDYFNGRDSLTCHFLNQLTNKTPTIPSWKISHLMVSDRQIKVNDRVEILSDKGVLACAAESFDDARRIYFDE